MSKIAELDTYKLGKSMGEVTPNEKELKTDNEVYRRGFKVGRKAVNKDRLETALHDSADLRREIKSLIKEYRRTQDSALYAQIIDKYQLFSDMQIKDAEDEEFVLYEDESGETQLGKKYSKNNLDGAKQYLEENTDTEIVGKDEDGNVYIGEKADKAKKENEKDVIDDNNKFTTMNDYKLIRVSDSQYNVHKDGDTSYKLIKVKDHWGCTCTGYYYRGACKHLDMLKGKVADSELAASADTYTREQIKAVADKVGKVLDGKRWEVSGDYRRGLDKIGYAPIVVEDSAEGFGAVKDKLVEDGFIVMVADSNLIRGYCGNVPTVLMRAADGQMATFLLSTTGSVEENKRLRDCAKKKGYRLVENGLFDSAGNLMRCSDEKSIYNYLGEKYKEPSER